jgi:hypothetical protein
LEIQRPIALEGTSDAFDHKEIEETLDK